jgi:prepilin-type N-terminal cleavage/methylation domain-containing protein
MPRLTHKSAAAFTLMELMTVIVIICILASMVLALTADLRNRADRAGCVTNLKSLYVAAATYVQQNGQWPQISTSTLKTHGDTQYPTAWINALAPFGLAQKNWICPSVQRDLHNPDFSKQENIRVDYFATPFDAKAGTPYLWPHQPWFVERGPMHIGGNLIIWSNGQIVTLTEAMQYQ